MRHSDNRVLAVWGSPSCGKTTIAAKVANYIANKGFDVALLLCDTDAPPLPLLVPPSEIETEKSLGSILAAAKITESLVMQNCITFKFVYPNVPTLGTNLVKADHISLIHLYSKYIFAQARVEVRTNRGSEIKDQLIVFCFEKATTHSLEFMYDMIKQLNLQDAQEYIFYLFERETPIRQIVGEFTTRVNSQISGDLENPSTVTIKYLDIYDGMTNVPDTIINFEEE